MVTNKTTKLQKLAQNIKSLRESKKLSQMALAVKLGISREHLAKIETAKRGLSLDLLFNLAEVLGVSEQEFFKF
ncbi:TPA: transcriptional regulator [Candidatus Gastranaerophilales bacterium HUM_21]|nr:MAG TPA: transcriptional regulator [Candidatus Gastranaerophilales bacterium HUM_21]